MFTLGMKYSFSYLANVKFEYSSLDSQLTGTVNNFTASFTVGF